MTEMNDAVAIFGNKEIVVVGASSGIGREIARAASKAGASVHLLGRSRERLDMVRQELDGSAHVHVMDMLDETSVERVFQTIGSFDFMTLTAVADETKLMSPISAMSTEKAQRGMEKFWGTFNCLRAAAKTINRDGAITVTSSVGVDRPSKSGAAVMNAASAAVISLARALALEIAPVRVNIVSPGVVGSGVWSDEERVSLDKWARDSLPVKYLGTPADLARAYIGTLANPYMTGSVTTVDGGLLLT